jgi:hypothetical protein
MIHVLTVHHQTDRWIDIQLRYLAQNLDRPYRVVADLEEVNGSAAEQLDAVTNLSGEAGASVRHHDKLNRLAELVCARAAPDDVLMFLDGDAFPIAPIGDFIEERLGHTSLAAVRRDENVGDKQPHPCFCVTTVGFWQEIGGDWSPGTWMDDRGREVDDVGGRLLWILRERGIEWSPLLRTNRHSLHPVLFGVYDHRVYHHGAGFRSAFVRGDINRFGAVVHLPLWLPPEPPESMLGWGGWKLRAKLWYIFKKRPLVKRQQEIGRSNDLLSDRVFEWIREDPEFHRRV